MPLLVVLAIHHVGFVPCLAVVLSQMVGILKDESNGSIPSEAPDAKVQPILSVVVHTDIRVALDLDGER